MNTWPSRTQIKDNKEIAGVGLSVQGPASTWTSCDWTSPGGS